jgi:hypothetical protein
MWSPETIKLEYLVRTDGARLGYLVKFERIEIILFPKKGLGTGGEAEDYRKVCGGSAVCMHRTKKSTYTFGLGLG